MPSETSRLAVLIDADNTSPKHAGAVLREVARYGLPTVKRAYGDWTTQNLVGWKNTLPQHAIQPVQQFANTSGKNSTDSAMIIDAMDLLYAGHLDGFAIVSSDSDFTRLATRLRESGLTVYGLGARKTPASLVAACDRFIYLELLDADTKEEQQAEEADVESPARRPDLRRILVAAIDSTSHDDGWASLGAVGSYISANNPSFDARDYGSPRLGALLSAQDYLEVDLSATGQAQVRLKAPTKAPAKKATARKRAAKKG
ncbi:NYN domain-containing protein [Nocardioides sp. cx-169]|uniref:NYN domain-containing protein n=1 Tax=Nocardioides sp. cx-169 TaxID=2899080 RepID=UPI001E47F626|nr:NYN domain-containing protein [Nocardioides sp. cx-169]MCD4536290.1 NYN domain-containing protein [Nocardioides sp. cx-169]